MTAKPLSSDWVSALVEGSARRDAVAGLDGVVSLSIGKTTSVTLDISDGRVLGTSDGTAEVDVPFTAKQLEAWSAGDFQPSVAYMMGDLKPVGATGPLLGLLAVMDDPDVIAAVAEQP